MTSIFTSSCCERIPTVDYLLSDFGNRGGPKHELDDIKIKDTVHDILQSILLSWRRGLGLLIVYIAEEFQVQENGAMDFRYPFYSLCLTVNPASTVILLRRHYMFFLRENTLLETSTTEIDYHGLVYTHFPIIRGKDRLDNAYFAARKANHRDANTK